MEEFEVTITRTLTETLTFTICAKNGDRAEALAKKMLEDCHYSVEDIERETGENFELDDEDFDIDIL